MSHYHLRDWHFCSTFLNESECPSSLRLLRWQIINMDLVVILMLLHPSLILQCLIPIREYSTTISGAILSCKRALKQIVTRVSWNAILRRRRRPNKDCDRSLPTMHSVGQGTIYHIMATSILETHNYLQHFRAEREGVICRLLRLFRALL